MKSADIKNLAYALSELTTGKNPDEVQKAVSDFAVHLKKKGLLGKGKAIIEEYRTITNTKQGIVEAEITVSSPLSESARKALQETLKKKYAATEVQLHERIDQRLIGGMKVKVADEVFDGSVQTALKKLEAKLLQ